MKGRSPTEKQKKFHSFLASKGCAICGEPGSIHHCVGRSAKHNKIHIGQDFVICLCTMKHHQYGPESVHQGPIEFAALVGCEKRLEAEKKIFMTYALEYGLDSDLIDLIMGYHK